MHNKTREFCLCVLNYRKLYISFGCFGDMTTQEEIILRMIKLGLVLDYSGSQSEGTAGNVPAGDAKAQYDLLAQVAGKLHLPSSVNSRSPTVKTDIEGIRAVAKDVGLEVIVGAHDILDLNDTDSAVLMQQLYTAGARFFIAPAGFTPGTTDVDRKYYAGAVLVGGSTSLEGWREQHQIGADLVIFPGANLRPDDLGTYWPLLHRRVPMGISGPIVPEELRKATAAQLDTRIFELQQAIQPYINGGALFILNGWPIKQRDLKESTNRCRLYLDAIQRARSDAPSPVKEMYAAIATSTSLRQVADQLDGTPTPLKF